ncbi:hypothetical protein IC619_016545 [Hazenella sp. IB182353]|nr:hypothetical protein [Polycladospora coralii]
MGWSFMESILFAHHGNKYWSILNLKKCTEPSNFDCNPPAFNHFLTKGHDTYEEIGGGLTYNSCSRLLTQLKKEIVWLKEVDIFSLQNALKNLADAFSRFFKQQNDPPRFKFKRIRLTITLK